MGAMKELLMNQSYAEGALDERIRVMAIVKEIKCEDEIGEYVYLKDLAEYLENPDIPEIKRIILALIESELQRIKKLPFKSNNPAEVIRAMSALETAQNAIRGVEL